MIMSCSPLDKSSKCEQQAYTQNNPNNVILASLFSFFIVFGKQHRSLTYGQEILQRRSGKKKGDCLVQDDGMSSAR